jgi:DNA-binding response OmpR family regulator
MVGNEQQTNTTTPEEIAQAEANPQEATASRPRDWFGGLQCVCPIHLLIVDDEAAICVIVQKALTHAEINVETISDPKGIEAKLRDERGKYHLIILDYVIPGLEPPQVLTWLQEYQPQASIVVMTAYPSIDSAVHCLRARTFDYLTKPFQIPDLKKVVLRCLESKGLLRMSEEALRESLGAAIRERRKSQGLTLAQMAERANVSLGYLSQIELGKNSASIETLYRISLGLGVKMADLFEQAQLH